MRTLELGLGRGLADDEARGQGLDAATQVRHLLGMVDHAQREFDRGGADVVEAVAHARQARDGVHALQVVEADERDVLRDALAKTGGRFVISASRRRRN